MIAKNEHEVRAIAARLTAPFNNMQTLKFKAQPTNVLFATVNQMFGGFSQLPTTVERGNQIDR